MLSKYLNSRSLLAWPSAETLAGELGPSKSGVRRSIKRLTAPGRWFTLEKGGGRKRSNVYCANFERIAARPPVDAKTVSASHQSDRRVAPEPMSPKGASNVAFCEGLSDGRRTCRPRQAPAPGVRQPFICLAHQERARDAVAPGVHIKTRALAGGNRVMPVYGLSTSTSQTVAVVLPLASVAVAVHVI